MSIKRRRPALNRQKRATYRRRFLRKLARFTRKQKARRQRGGSLSEPAAQYKDAVVSFTPTSDKIGDPDMVGTQASLDVYKETEGL